MKYAVAVLVGLVQVNAIRVAEYPQPDIRGANPANAHGDSTFSSTLHNDWTLAQKEAEKKAKKEESESDDTDSDLDLGSESDSSDDDDLELAQLGEIDHFVSGFEGAGAQDGYKRQMPAEFSKMNDDRLMNSLIATYAIEMKTTDGGPSGHFYLNKEGAS